MSGRTIEAIRDEMRALTDSMSDGLILQADYDRFVELVDEHWKAQLDARYPPPPPPPTVIAPHEATVCGSCGCRAVLIVTPFLLNLPCNHEGNAGPPHAWTNPPPDRCATCPTNPNCERQAERPFGRWWR